MNYLVIENVLSSDLLQQVRHALNAGPFDNGKETAQGLAKAMKNNQQLAVAPYAGLLDAVGRSIVAHPMVQSYAIPHLASRPIINRYTPGMEYGLHVDNAFMADVRTDLSYTLFIDDAATYEGGELLITGLPGTQAFKLHAGHLLIYPTGSLHRVAQVTRGQRHAVVGWIQSRIRDAQQREIVGKLNALKDVLRQSPDQLPAALQANECIQNLLRMWGE
jgi:PKHD-type hydroxylase